MQILYVENIKKSYFPGGNEVEVLHGLDFGVEKGDFVSIMGPSGSGKSTLMHILGGLDRPTAGRYVLDETEISSLNDEQMSSVRNQKVGFVFQAFFLIPQNTVLENVLLPSRYSLPRDGVEDAARQLLEAVGLGERIDFLPNQLSGGQCQRVAICRSLLNDPAIIMADEPTGNLDTKTGLEIMGILQYLNSLGKTVLMVTHEREIALHSNKILHLRDGIIESWEIVEHPVKAETEIGTGLKDFFNS